MQSLERTVFHGPDVRVVFSALAGIVLTASLVNNVCAQGSGDVEMSSPREFMSLQDRMRLLKRKQSEAGSQRPSTANSYSDTRNNADNPYSNYRSQTPTASARNQPRPFETANDDSGFRPTRTAGYSQNDPQFTPHNPMRESDMSAEPLGGWRTSDRPSSYGATPVGYDSPASNPQPNSSSVYQPTNNPEQFVSQPPLSRLGEIPDATQPSGPPSHVLLPQTPDPEAGLSRWDRLKLRLSAGQPMTVQNTFTTATWLFSNPNDVGLFDFYSQATFLSPSRPGFSFTPSLQVYFFDGPTRTDLPARVYSFRGEFRQQLPLHERLAVDLAVSPGVYSDFEQGGSDAVRVLGRVLFSYLWSEHSQILFGFLYLDRDDVNVLPAGGWIYTPTDDVRLELVFPRPKFAYRASQTAAYSRWIYLAGEFGGDAWAVERSNGTQDTLAYRDLRLIFGFEQKYVNGRSLMLEAGYVFSRQIEFTSNIGDFDPGSTGMLRAGLVY